MKIIGQYDTAGIYMPFIHPCEVVQVGNTLRDKTDGIVTAVMDDYGDWVNSNLRRLGVKCKMKIATDN